MFGVLVGLLTFVPRPTMTAADPVDPDNPFSSAFTVSNTGFVPLRDTNVYFGVGQIVGSGADADPGLLPSFKSRLVIPAWNGHDLSMDDKFTITPGIVFEFPGTLGFADIAFVVSYKPWILPFRREKTFRFVTHRQSNGKLYWYSQTLETPAP